MPIFPVVAGVVQLSTATPAATDTYQNGVLVSASGDLVRASTTGGDEVGNGLLRTVDGQIVYVDATAGLPANTQYCNGVPLNSSGAVCTSTNAVATYSNGLPMAANGALCVTVSA